MSRDCVSISFVVPPSNHLVVVPLEGLDITTKPWLTKYPNNAKFSMDEA